MSFSYTPVTVEQYDQALRDSVNAYYIHAMNDPSMSREEALATTHEMAERYLAERESLMEAYEKGEIASEKDAVVLDNGGKENANNAALNNVGQENANVGLQGNNGADPGSDPGMDGGAEEGGGIE